MIEWFDRRERSIHDSAAAARASDLDSWLGQVDEFDELKRITAEVDSDLELSTRTYLPARKSPAFLRDCQRLSRPARALEHVLSRDGTPSSVSVFEDALVRPSSMKATE